MPQTVLHRDDLLTPPSRHAVLRGVDFILTWITDHVLASRLLFIVALVVPLVSLFPGLQNFQKFVIILSSNWIQLWALPALQRSQIGIQSAQNAKADVDHNNLTLILEKVSAISDNQCRGCK